MLNYSYKTGSGFEKTKSKILKNNFMLKMHSNYSKNVRDTLLFWNLSIFVTPFTLHIFSFGILCQCIAHTTHIISDGELLTYVFKNICSVWYPYINLWQSRKCNCNCNINLVPLYKRLQFRVLIHLPLILFFSSLPPNKGEKNWTKKKTEFFRRMKIILQHSVEFCMGFFLCQIQFVFMLFCSPSTAPVFGYIFLI